MTDKTIVIICANPECGCKYSIPQDTDIAICPKCDWAVDLQLFQQDVQG